jgi:3-deoxy-7-phosphoheptulonate synthase
MDESGALAHVKTLGNETAHVILRGSDTGTNYGPEDIQAAKELLNEKGLLESIIVDASHGNSNKKAENQIKVIASVSEQIALGEVAIRGVMIESNLKAGNQNLKDASGNYRPKEDLEPGVSVTDECVDLTETAQMLKLLAQAASSRRKILQHIG